MDIFANCTLNPDGYNTISEPTRVCAVCGKTEFEHTGSYYSQDVFWLCPECLKRLKKLLDKEDF